MDYESQEMDAIKLASLELQATLLADAWEEELEKSAGGQTKGETTGTSGGSGLQVGRRPSSDLAESRPAPRSRALPDPGVAGDIGQRRYQVPPAN